MRWPFHFGSSGRSEKQAAEVPTGGTPPQRRDWASLPAIPRTIGDAGFTAAMPDFVESLAGEHDMELGLQPLGHHVSMEAPHGLVTGIVQPISNYAPSSELVGRPRPAPRSVSVQRATGTTSMPRAETPATSAEPELETPPSSLGPAESSEPEPFGHVRSLAALEAPAAGNPAPLTRVPEAVRAALVFVPPVQRTAASPEPAEVAVPVEHVMPVEASPAAQRLTLGQSRRLGLGAPLVKRPEPSVQRTGEPAARPVDMPLVSRTTDRKTETQPQAPLATRATDLEVAAETATTLQTPTRAATAPPLAPTVTAAGEPGAGLVIAQRVVATSLPPLLFRANPAPSVPIASSPERTLVARLVNAGSGTSQPEAAAAVPAVQRLSRPSSTAYSARVLPASFVEAVPLQRSLQASPGLGGAEPTSDLAPLDLPLPPSASMRPAIAEAHERAVATAAQRATPTIEPPAMPLALAARRTDPMPSGAAPLVHHFAATVQREEPSGEGASSPIAPAGSEGAAVAAASSAVAAPSAAAPAAGGHESEKDLDDLARKLQDRISAQIRHELLVERERAGLVTDLR